MPDEYSYNDFMQMQQQAIDRVREMQKKAAPHEKANTKYGSPAIVQDKQSSDFIPPIPNKKAKEPPQKPPVATVHSHKKPSESPSKPHRKQNPLSFLSNMDSDMSLILPLLLLLGKEGADNILLLALLYIIS